MRNFLLVLFLFVLPAAYAQQFTTPMRIQTPYGTVTHHVPVGPRFPTYYHGGSARAPVSHKHDFVVILKNDSVVVLRDAIDISDSVHLQRVTSRERGI